MSILGPPNAFFYLKEPELLGEMFDSRSETRNVQGKLGTPYRKAMKLSDLGLCQKDTGVNLKRLLLAKWNNLSIKMSMTQWTKTHQMY